jgi:hypothetical protein
MLCLLPQNGKWCVHEVSLDYITRMQFRLRPEIQDILIKQDAKGPSICSIEVNSDIA